MNVGADDFLNAMVEDHHYRLYLKNKPIPPSGALTCNDVDGRDLLLVFYENEGQSRIAILIAPGELPVADFPLEQERTAP